MLNTGVLLGRFHLYSQAIQYFETATKIDPSSDEAKYDLANARFQNRDYDGALRAAESISPEGQKDSSWFALIADIYLHSNRGEDAVQALQQALVRSPDNEQYYVSLALAQLQIGDTEHADRTLRQGLGRIPDSGFLYWAAGVAAVVRGSQRDAEANLKKAAELMPSRETPLASLGVFYYEAGRIGDAREILQRCAEMFPQGTLDIERVEAALDAAGSSPKSSSHTSPELSLQARREFYQLAVAMADGDR